MIVKNYIRSIVSVGGSSVVAIPPPFMRRKKLAFGMKLLVIDGGDTLTVKTINEQTLKELMEDEQRKYTTNELKRLKILSRTYREQKIDKQTKEKVKWQSKKRKQY